MNIAICGLGLIVIVVAFLFYIKQSNDYAEPKKPRLKIGILLIGIGLIILSSCFTIIPTGYTGVKSTFGQISSETLQNGFNLKLPYIQKIEKVNNKQQDIEFDGDTKICSETSERTAICYSGVTVTYQIAKDKSAWIYANVSNYEDSLVSQSLISSAIKTSSKRLEDVEATDRSKIESTAQNAIQQSMDEKYGKDTVLINKVVIESADFDEEYDAAIAAKQKAELEAEQQKIENERAIEKAEADATVTLTNAQASADAKMISAKATADANKLLEESLTENVLLNAMLSKWDGKMPAVMSNVPAILDLNGIISED